MNSGLFLPTAPRLPMAAVIVLAAIFLAIGVTGHDPWKTEDAIHIGIAYRFATQGHWLTPIVAGEAWPHTAPLYHWLAAASGKLLGGLLPFHDAARLATLLCGGLFLFFLAGAARAFHGEAAGRLAPLLAIGTIGLMLPLHEAQPAVAGLASAALAWWGAGLLWQGKTRGALPLGLGLGLAFPAHGLAGLVMAAAALSAPIIKRDAKSFGLALLIALPLIAIWPWLLSQHAPAYLTQWWQNEIAEATTARSLPAARHLEQLTWATWPILPLGCWGLWLHRPQLGTLSVPLVGILLALLWFFSGSARTLAMMPLMIPLTLIAAAGADRMRRGMANAFDWFALMTFTFTAVLIWLGASAQAFDWPPRIAHNFNKLAPGHAVHYGWLTLTIAGVLSLGWLMSLGLRRAPWRASLRWAAGTTLMWALTALLWMSWIDHSKTYRPVALAVRAAVPETADCIERVNLGPAHLASLDYFAGIRTVPPSRKRTCAWRLSLLEKDRAAPEGWQEVWQGGRSSDRKERWFLYRRAD